MFSYFYLNPDKCVAISESNPMVLQKYVLVLWLYLSFSVENESRNLILINFTFARRLQLEDAHY